MSGRPDVFLSAAEASGDMHAAGLVRALHRCRPDLSFEAVGGDRLRQAGALLRQDTVAKARFGLTSFLRAKEVWSMLRLLDRLWRQSPPRLVVACDSWTMNKHVLALAKKHGSQTMYYVSPQVWASRPGRVTRLAELAQKVACILPFEEAWLRERGVDATYVGHPLFDDMPPVRPRETASFPETSLRLGLNFGSRINTVRANLPGLVAAASDLRERFQGTTVVTPTVAATDELVRSLVPNWVDVACDGFDEVISTCDLVLTTSGTATLHTAAHDVPMVVVYRGSRLLWETVGKRIVQARTFALVNLLHPEFASGTRVVDEHIPWSGDPRPVVESAMQLLSGAESLEKARSLLRQVVDPLRAGHAGDAAAQMAIGLLEGRS